MSTNFFATAAPFDATTVSVQPTSQLFGPLTPIGEGLEIDTVFNWRTATPDLNAPVNFQAPTEGLQSEQVELLQEWEKVQAQLKSLKLYEMELRKCVVYEAGLFNADKKSGVERVTLAGGYQLETTKKENYNLKQDKNAIEAALEPFTDTEAELLVTWKASLSVANYKKLPDEKKAYFNNVLEITDGAPTLEIKAPKVKA